ncbi:Nmad5 family putative nucleotide modification protein [Orbaceae bacterium ESL0721]|nr:Nmad5 family putative nucleotide modification protein [Orbaceae bacterium ESL0721]
MTRLNKAIKDQILKNAMESAPCVKRVSELSKLKHELAVEIYNTVTSGHDAEETGTALQSLKAGTPFDFQVHADTNYLKTQSLWCSFGGQQLYLEFPSDGVTRYKVKRDLTMFAGDHEFSKRFMDIDQNLRNAKREKKDLEIDIWTVLNSCRTAAQLEKFWPASVNYLEGCEVCAEIKGLPAVMVEGLNAKLGINA